MPFLGSFPSPPTGGYFFGKKDLEGGKKKPHKWFLWQGGIFLGLGFFSGSQFFLFYGKKKPKQKKISPPILYWRDLFIKMLGKINFPKGGQMEFFWNQKRRIAVF